MAVFNEDVTVNGELGVNVSDPRTPLHVLGRISTGRDFTSAGAVTFFPPDGFAWFHVDNGPAGGRPTGRLRISHGNQPGDNEIVNILQNGRVGLGLDNPTARLHVNGSIRTTGDIILENADCAEEFDLAEGCRTEPGDVLRLGRDGALAVSTTAYDKRVAGVVSGAGRYRPALVLDRQDESTSRVAVALLGKVCCKVDATESPVEVGDMLTTAETPGHAMRATDRDRAFGAVLGKALAPVTGGRALVPVLVALQ